MPLELPFACTPARRMSADTHCVTPLGGLLLRLLVCFRGQRHADANGYTCSYTDCHGGGRGNRSGRRASGRKAGTCVHARADAGTYSHSHSGPHGNRHSYSDRNPLDTYPRALPTTRRERLLRPSGCEVYTSLAEPMSTLGELAYRLITDPTLVGDQAWNAQVTAVSSALQSNAQRIREIQPVPSSVQHIHADLEELTALLDGGFEAFAQGLESGELQLLAIGAPAVPNLSRSAQ